MISIPQIIACIVLPLIVTVCFSIYSYRKLLANSFFTLSHNSLRVFILSRGLYILSFGILISALALGIISYGVGGEQTRLLIAATTPNNYDTASLIMCEWSNILLPVIFITIFISIFALAYMGKLVLNKFPADGKPGVEFSGFRFTFFLVALSLMMPPLLFASLLLI